jgi:hypothetical protein
MKENKTVPEKTIVIDLNLSRELVVALSCILVVAALLAVLTLTRESAMASEAQTAKAASTGMRQFYLTDQPHGAEEALTICAPGYHFASLWEIADTTNLKYNTGLGWTAGDSGQGPPTDKVGWLRTGYTAHTGVSTGRANCSAWTSSDGSDNGTRAWLNSDWVAGQDIGLWTVGSWACSGDWRVWCVED